MTATPSTIRTIRVELSANAYPIVIGAGCLAQLGEQIAAQGIKAGTKVLVVTNPVVETHYVAMALASLQAAGFDASTLVIEAGEDQKTPHTVALIHDAAFERRLERGSLIVALGGGVVGANAEKSSTQPCGERSNVRTNNVVVNRGWRLADTDDRDAPTQQ